MKNDLQKFLLSQSISSTFQSDYYKKMQKVNNAYIIEGNGAQVDIFSKLLDDRIIFLSTEIYR